MKKFLLMFALMATTVLSALTLVSCHSEDIINDDQYKTKHKYSPAVEIVTSKSEWKAAAIEESKKMTNEIASQLKIKEMELTETDASLLWTKLLNESDELSNLMQATADDYGKQADDTSLKCVFKLMEDGQREFRSKEWLTRYWL